MWAAFKHGQKIAEEATSLEIVKTIRRLGVRGAIIHPPKPQRVK